MILIEGVSRWRKRRKRIRELQDALREVDRQKYDDDPEVDAHLRDDMARDGEHELEQLLDEPLLKAAAKWGLDIPGEYWDDSDSWRDATLLHPGRNWIKREVGKRRREWAKDWIAILSPFLSAIIAILGLLVALRKH